MRTRILEFEEWKGTVAPEQSNPGHVPVNPEPIATRKRVSSKNQLPDLSAEIAGDIEASNLGSVSLVYHMNPIGITTVDIENMEKSIESYLGDSVSDVSVKWDEGENLVVSANKLRDLNDYDEGYDESGDDDPDSDAETED